jgi:uncharacterized protein (DUF1499 family)
MEPRFRWLLVVAVVVAVMAAVTLLASGVGVRAGLWTFRSGLAMLRLVALLAIAGVALAAIALAATRPAGSGAALLLGALAVSGAVFWVPWRMAQQARGAPVIHDITTDTAEPPAFVAVLPLRAGAANPSDYGGAEVAAQQAKAYPDIRPLYLAAAPGDAFPRAHDAARRMGWTIVAADPSAGRIEATATTRWFGFKDDVVVRIRPDGTGSRVDVRSLSRVGRSDLGTNARRIRDYLSRLSSR